MKKSFFLILLLSSFLMMFAGSEPIEHKKLPEAELRPILDTIRSDAITFGEGKKEVHVFVDPMCPLSKEYLQWVTSSEKLLKRYRYYVYMYKLKKYDSTDLVRHIYSQPYQFTVLKDVMVNNNLPEIKPSEFAKDVDIRIARIAEAAKAIDVYKRPYFIVLRSEK